MQASARFRDAHTLEPFDDALLSGSALDVLVTRQHFGHLRADGHVRCQRGERVLEDHGHARAANFVQLLTRQAGEFLTVKLDRALDNAVGGREAHRGQHGLALARAALADEAKALACPDAEGQLLHSLDEPILRLEGDRQVADIKKRLGQ